MEAPRRPRLRLSRRRLPSGAGEAGAWGLRGDRPPRPRPRSPQDNDGAGERARLWAELLRTVSADRGVDGELPPLPAFPAEVRAPDRRGDGGGGGWASGRNAADDPGPQEPRLDPARAAPPEVFTVGPETFSWTPFPPAPRGAEGPGCSYRVLRGAGGRPGSPAPSLPGCPPPEPREAPPVPERPAGGGAQTLQSCPMCQADFAPGLAQLDIDSHLAQCLADSTEDVEW
ncbi:hypothetical protein QTO34_019157 [Cnephaeus nilssonii]|uniref:UBZ2-type domain-containing protein n=1 Tax=Cnephaeus nilssonii TaxID=3371016 RepID=A0AA40I052_CNENI|nr:hypothetical protein QTO34_019157 [Eptesicus nilssonii]